MTARYWHRAHMPPTGCLGSENEVMKPVPASHLRIAPPSRSLAEKEELLAADPEKLFTEPHYNGFPAVLVRLPAIGAAELAELITDAWRCQAPRALAAKLGSVAE